MAQKKKIVSKKISSREKLFKIIQVGSRDDLPSFIFDIALITIVILNIFSLILESFEQLSSFAPVFNFLDVFSLVFFLVEFILRIYTADLLYPGIPRVKAVFKFIFSLDGMIQLLTIIPIYYLSGFVVFRLFRVARILRLFKINSTYDSFHVILSVFKEKSTQIQSSVLIILILMLASSLCMYSVENSVQPEAFPNALSGLWWAATTIFTVGYGDVYPITTIGKFIGIIIDFFAMAFVAIPTGIISAAFVEKYTAVHRNQASGEEKAGLITMTVTKDTPYLRKEIGLVEDEEALDILILIRDGVCVVPTRNIKLKNEDILVCRKTDIY